MRSNVQDEGMEDCMQKLMKAAKVRVPFSERRPQRERKTSTQLPKPLHVREKGLEKEIGEESKAMAMLLKMGIKSICRIWTIRRPSSEILCLWRWSLTLPTTYMYSHH